MADLGDDSVTSLSLLMRVGRAPTDEAAWAEFVDRYGPKILAWGRGWGLQPADAEDMAQAVLVKLARQMGRFSYDDSGSSRGWLWTLARNPWRDWVSHRARSEKAASGSEADDALASVEARDDLLRRLEETFDLELLVEAVHRVRERVADKTWEAYRLTPLEDRPVPEVAAYLGMNVAFVFKAKSNVLKLIREEVAKLEGNPGDAIAG